MGAGGLVGSLLSPRIQRRLGMRNVLVASGWAPLAMLLYVAWGNVYVLAAAGAPASLLAPSANAMVVGYRVAATPDRLRGRVNSVARLIAQLGSPVGPLVAGLLLQSISAPATVAAIVAWMALLAAWTTVSPAIRAAPSLADVVKPEAVEALAQP